MPEGMPGYKAWLIRTGMARTANDKKVNELTAAGTATVLFQVRQFAEDLKTGVNFFAREILQSLCPEAFHGERSHHASVKQGALQHFPIEFALGRDVSHKSTGEGIACSGRILHLIDGQRGRAKRMRADAECPCLKAEE